MTLKLFEGFGIEIEHMIVDQESLAVQPICDQLLSDLNPGKPVESEVERGSMAWSNELVLHVVEFKTNGPRTGFEAIARDFQREVEKANALLSKYSACLLPTGMHPFMNPDFETKIWPHEYTDVYRSFDRIFNCHGHGWSNLQSTHLNLPFSNDDEFRRLHSAIRLILPLLPALSASSPLADGSIQNFLDFRLECYRKNCLKYPSVTGGVIPEVYFSKQDYEERVLQKIYKEMAKEDPEGILQGEWVNARGVIARFDRMALEIRVLDCQENVFQDLSLCEFIACCLKMLIQKDPLKSEEIPTSFLQELFLNVIKSGGELRIDQNEYLRALGVSQSSPSVRSVFRELLKQATEESDLSDFSQERIRFILDEGCLSERILDSIKNGGDLKLVYQKLADCLRLGVNFEATSV